ncbi:hypothetical protein ACJX0J_006214, partial [Zea mays]
FIHKNCSPIIENVYIEEPKNLHGAILDELEYFKFIYKSKVYATLNHEHNCHDMFHSIESEYLHLSNKLNGSTNVDTDSNFLVMYIKIKKGPKERTDTWELLYQTLYDKFMDLLYDYATQSLSATRIPGGGGGGGGGGHFF